MTVRAFVPFVLTFIANVIWQVFLLVSNPIPHGWGDIYMEAAAGWVLPSIANLVFLYRKGVFMRWQRVGRAFVLCGISATATHAALMFAIALLLTVDFTLHGTPEPNKPAAGKAVKGSVR